MSSPLMGKWKVEAAMRIDFHREEGLHVLEKVGLTSEPRLETSSLAHGGYEEEA